ncbi:MAG TPA: ATP phosphoribosyltransferase regulatory subunit [Roseiarcus sp.]|nr:ATP phosphoribosyltransferase regulatory subunit [Roseiarcus sp.]
MDPTSTLLAADAAGARALERLIAAGFDRIEPPALQPASVFLDMSGEEIRGRLFLTSGPAGEELCLRPDYTIPVCLAYLASPEAGRSAQYSYLGPVFRARAGQAGEWRQSGLESYGRDDAEAAEAEIFALAMEAAAAAGAGALDVRFGDAGLFDRALRALDWPDALHRRLRRGLAQGRSLDSILDETANGSAAQAGVLAALERTDHAGAKALVEDLLAIAGIAAVGGRSAGEIADRFLEQASLRAGSSAPAEKREALRRFLAIKGDPDSASRQLRALAADAKLDLAEALDSFDQRTGFLAARGVAVERCTFAAGFVRDLDYYTGFVFEAVDPQRADARPIIGGGRYDRLARRLGAARDIPAIGAAIWIDRIAEGKSR